MFDRVRDLLYLLCLPRVKNYGSFGTARKVVMQATRSSRPRAGCSVSLGTLMAATRQDLQTDDAYPWCHIQAVEICVSWSAGLAWGTQVHSAASGLVTSKLTDTMPTDTSTVLT